MKYRDEFHIASTAILLSVAMVGISVVVPKESRVPTAKTTLTEAPETAAEAEAAQQEEFQFTVRTVIMTRLTITARKIVPTMTAMILLAVILLEATRSLILLRILEIAQEVTLPIFRIIQKIPPMIPDKITMRTGIILIMEMVLVPIAKETIRRIPPIRILNTMNKKESCPAGLVNSNGISCYIIKSRTSGDFIII